jgi:hypothetical protein
LKLLQRTFAAPARLRRLRRAAGGVVVVVGGEEGRADSSAEKGFTEVLAKYPNRTI